MNQSISSIALAVKDYDEAIDFYVNKMGFELISDIPLEAGKRWVLVKPKGKNNTTLLLAKADGLEQEKAIGNQTGGRVFLFLNTDNFQRDYKQMLANGVEFLEKPRHEVYGTVAVFKDLYGNKWDLIESK
ncbi:VOC family protein [Spongiivirga citrea]|uniref:VOC family protein n=1 Tax=Spongiivirga citrea TaxID=1481457 RepID=A0A6M0CXE9_9FLAO|nr:VOC family protein [Spongiivirga citrea]NER18410.1 VOC family protein [Spongiivirga citrea]